MPFAILNPDGSIKCVFPKPSPFMRIEDGERMVGYNPPAYDYETEDMAVVTPVAGEQVEFTITPKAPEIVERVLMLRKTAVVQDHMDAAARALGYDNLLSAVSYAGSSHPIFGVEGDAFKQWRDACWDTTIRILADVKAGNRTVPTDSELVQELPPAP